MTSLEQVIKDYNNINTKTDLIKRGLTYYELIVIKECMKEINSRGYAINCISNVTKYFEKFGFKIEKYDNVNWKIIQPEK